MNSGKVITIVALFIALLLIGLTVTSMIAADTTTTEEELNAYLETTLKELSSYIKIKNVYGEFSQEKPYHIAKIAILVSPLFTEPLNISNWVIQLQTKNNLLTYSYNQTVFNQNQYSIFTHPSWNNLSLNSFGIISIIDNDDSLVKFSAFSDSSDLAFLVFDIHSYSITRGEQVTIVLTSGEGYQKTITFSIPLPTNTIASLY